MTYLHNLRFVHDIYTDLIELLSIHQIIYEEKYFLIKILIVHFIN